MTTYLRPVQHFSYGIKPFTPLEHAIVKGTTFGTIKYNSYGPSEITAPLESVARAVESAYVLTPREALPKITATSKGNVNRSFSGSNNLGATVQGGTSESARQSAALWLAIAGLLEKEEKDAADDAKKKADAEQAAESARHKRLDALASEYFDAECYIDLGPKKARVIDELYRLEEQLKQDDEDYGDDE